MMGRAPARALVNLSVGVFALAVALAIGAVFISVAGASPTEAYRAIWDGAFGSRPQVANTLQKSIPLLLVSLGWIVAYRARRLNIGLEGQVLIGAMCATFAGIHLDLPMFVALPASMLAGAVGGALWCGIAAWMWARLGVNEIISTLMLNLVAVQVVAWTLRGPLAGDRGDVIRSPEVAPGAQWPVLLERTPLTWALVLVPIGVLVVWFILQRTVFGYRLRFVGANADAAGTGGIDATRVSVQAMLFSGALAGTAGAVLVLGSQSHVLTDNISGGIGYSGIVIALLAGGSAFGAVISALLIAALAQGGGLMEARTGVSSDVSGVLQATVILLVAGTSVIARGLEVRLTGGRVAKVPAAPPTEPGPDRTEGGVGAVADDERPTETDGRTPVGAVDTTNGER